MFFFVICNCSHGVLPSIFAVPMREWLGEHSCTSSFPAPVRGGALRLVLWFRIFQRLCSWSFMYEFHHHHLISGWVHIWYILQCLFYKCLCNICAVCFLLLFPWFVIFILFKSILFFVNWISLYFFHIIKCCNVLLIIIIFWLGCDRPSGHLFSCPLWFFPYSRPSPYILCLFLYLISFLLFPCASVCENTRAWVPHFL